MGTARGGCEDRAALVRIAASSPDRSAHCPKIQEIRPEFKLRGSGESRFVGKSGRITLQYANSLRQFSGVIRTFADLQSGEALAELRFWIPLRADPLHLQEVSKALLTLLHIAEPCGPAHKDIHSGLRVIGQHLRQVRHAVGVLVLLAEAVVHEEAELRPRATCRSRQCR